MWRLENKNGVRFYVREYKSMLAIITIQPKWLATFIPKDQLHKEDGFKVACLTN